jgi:hypothetical protein
MVGRTRRTIIITGITTMIITTTMVMLPVMRTAETNLHDCGRRHGAIPLADLAVAGISGWCIQL